MKAKRILIPVIVLGGLTLASCSKDLVTNYSKSDLNIDTPWVDYNIPVTGVDIKNGQPSLTIEKGSNFQYEYSVTPKNATNKALDWQTSDESVATITNTGYLTAVGGGHANITVGGITEPGEDPLFHPVVLDVDVTVEIESFLVSYETTNMDWNREYAPTVAFTPADTTWTGFTYSIPEDEQTIATVDASSGVITTYEGTGTVHLTVVNERLGADHAQSITLDVRDRKIHVSSIALALGQGEADRIEIGAISSVVATVTPEDAEDIPTLKYFSRDDSIATVDATTGVITGVSAGTVNLFAVCEGVYSNDVEIEVYEVYATSISINNAGPITIDALDEEHTQITVTVGVNEPGATKPSLATPTFSSSDDSIVTVGENGELTVKQSGTVTITASIQGQSTVYSDTIEVHAKAYVTAISFDGPVAAYLEETVTITARLTPENVEDNEVEWDINPANKVEAQINGNQITLTPLAEGPVTLKATSTKLGVSNTHTVSFTERKVEFEEGEIYLVGNKQFNTGTSVSGVASWMNAKYAYKFVDITYDQETGARVEAHARVTLDEGTEFKLRIGPDPAESWRQNYEQAGAIDRVHLSHNSGGNVNVLTDGVYDIYYKYATDSTYIGIGPSIHFDKAEFSMGKTSSTKITLHDYEPPVVSCISTDTEVATVSEGVFVEGKGMEYTVTAVAPGHTTIEATDNAGNTATCNVEIRNDTSGVTAPIYLNANGIFTEAGAVPFIHAYNELGQHDDQMMTLVDGQTIIYTAEIAEEYTNVIFVRMPSGSTVLDWDTAWNETKSDDSLYGDNNMFTITGYDAEDGKYLTGTWGTFDPSHTYKVPSDFYLSGDFNNWTTYDEDYALIDQSTSTLRKYVIEGIELQEGSAVKVHDKDVANVPEEEQGAHWYANATEYPNCHYTLVNDGYGGKNMAMDATAVYDIEFYPDSEYGNTITFSIHGQVGASYCLYGSFNEWGESGDPIELQQDPSNSNKYFATGVSLTEGDLVKAKNTALGDEGWYGVSEEYTNCHFTVDASGNAVIDETATYTVNFYLNAENGNHLQFIKEGEEPVVGTKYYLLGLGLNNWTASDEFLMTVDPQDSNKYTITGVELTVGDKIKANNPDLGDEGWYGVGSEYDNCHFTVDASGNAVIDETGTYTVNLYVALGEGETNHLQFIKEGTPVITANYYLKGTFNEWGDIGDPIELQQDPTDSNKYSVTEVALTEGDKIKVNNPDLGDDGWYGVDHPYESCHFTVDASGNAVIDETATYTVNFYVNSDDGNHIQLIKTSSGGGGDTPVVTEKTYYFTNNYGWSNVYAYVWNDSTGAKQYGNWPGVKLTSIGKNDMNQDIFAVTIDTSLYNHVIFTNNSGAQTADLALTSFGAQNACYISGGEASAYTVGYWTYQG